MFPFIDKRCTDWPDRACIFAKIKSKDTGNCLTISIYEASDPAAINVPSFDMLRARTGYLELKGYRIFR